MAEVLVVHTAVDADRDVRHLLDQATAARPPSPLLHAHALLRAVLADLTGRPPQEHVLVRTCATCGGPHGKPVLAGSPWHVSLSATSVRAAVVVTTAGPVGVDLELSAATGFHGFAGVALGPREQDGDTAHRARAWTRKEAALKATGTGLAVDPRTVDVRGGRALGAHLLDVDLPGPVAAAVAVLCKQRPVLRVEERTLRP